MTVRPASTAVSRAVPWGTASAAPRPGAANYGEGRDDRARPDQTEKPTSRRVVLGIWSGRSWHRLRPKASERDLRRVQRGPRRRDRQLGPGNGGFTDIHDHRWLPRGATGLPLDCRRDGRTPAPADRRRPGGSTGHPVPRDFQRVYGLASGRCPLVRRAPYRTGPAGRALSLPPQTCISPPSTVPIPRASRWTRPKKAAPSWPTRCSAFRTREHGGPVRLFVPGMFGYKSIKWLSGIRLVDRCAAGLLGAERLPGERLDHRPPTLDGCLRP